LNCIPPLDGFFMLPLHASIRLQVIARSLVKMQPDIDRAGTFFAAEEKFAVNLMYSDRGEGSSRRGDGQQHESAAE
jgi:hypothetical protein